MENYHTLGCLAPSDIVARAIDHEMKKSVDDYVYLDITHLEGYRIRERFPNIYQTCLQFGFDMVFTGPKQLDPEDEFIGLARNAGVSVSIERDAQKAVENADLVVADTWVSMHDSQSAKERRHNMLRPYQVNEELMSHAKPDALFMHCLPAHREEEATSAVMDGPNSVIFDEAENRLHAQKAIMRWCLGK